MCVGCNPVAGVDCQRPTTPTKKASPKPKAKKPKKGDRKKRDK
jgi:hypothetical protein